MSNPDYDKLSEREIIILIAQWLNDFRDDKKEIFKRLRILEISVAVIFAAGGLGSLAFKVLGG